MRCLLVLAAAAASLGLAGRAAAATYYVSPSGSNSAAGTTPAAAWQTVAKVNSTSLAPGDSVLFAGGSTFTGLLQPQGSGTSASPIGFGSYGSGSATLSGGIQLASQSWLVVDGLRVDTGAWQTSGSTRGIRTSDTGSGVQNVVVRNSQFVNLAIGLLFSNHLDAHWTVSNNLIQYTRDSGILIFDPGLASEVGGTDLTFTGNQILDTGLDTSLNYNKHGAYDIGTDTTWRNNVIKRFQASGLSIRAHGTIIEGNTIADGPYPINASPYDATGAVTRIAYNKLLNASGAAIELNASGTVPNAESYVIANNTATATGSARGFRIAGTSGFVHLANNAVVTAGGAPLYVDSRPSGGYTETNNVWFSPPPVTLSYLGSGYATLSAYRAASGAGQSDLQVDPMLDASGDPAAASPAVQAGTTAVDGSVTYVGDCSGAIYHYCGLAPDAGAVELVPATPAPPVAPPPAPAPVPPPSGGGGGGGGGGGAVPPDLALSLTADPAPKAIGDQFTYAYRLVNNSVAGSGSSVLTINLPAGVQLVGVQVNRGPGCSTSGQTITCPLDFFPGKFTDTVWVTVKVTADGDLVASGSVWSFPSDSKPSDDAASLTTKIQAAVPAAAPPPARLVCVVPRVVGLTLSAARASLAKAGCATGAVTLTTAKRGKVGRVVRQLPPAGTRLVARARVKLVVRRR